MGLQTGTKLAVTKTPIIDPSNLRIVAYEVDGPLLSERPSFIRIADVRELSDIGMIIDSNDEFIGVKDVIAIQKIYDLGFKLLGLSVVDESKHKLGKVSDYTVDSSDFVIQQLNVARSVMRSLTETSLLVHRSQIIEINDTTITVRNTAKKLEPIKDTPKMAYLNPFRSSNTPQIDNAKI
jgi:sporulation protein YlmC with PRC-barrel domain